MFNRLIEDLRFVVGMLFGTIGLILLAVALGGEPQAHDDLHLNLMTGLAMVVFALAMVGMAVRAVRLGIDVGAKPAE